MIQIAASILAADFSQLGQECQAAITAGADWIHVDVMDNHFVPNLSMGPAICQSLNRLHLAKPMDVHLMVTDPASLFQSFISAGAKMIMFHPETTLNIEQNITALHQAGCQAGLVISPDTPLSLAAPYVESIDLLLLMTVYPGFGGQRLLENTYQKIAAARSLLDSHCHKPFLGVDGGINLNTIGAAAKAGADYFVVGSGLFSEKDYAHTIKVLRQTAEAAL